MFRVHSVIELGLAANTPAPLTRLKWKTQHVSGKYNVVSTKHAKLVMKDRKVALSCLLMLLNTFKSGV